MKINLQRGIIAPIKSALQDLGMGIKHYLFIPLILPLLLTGSASAQFNGDGLKGVYYINTNLTSAAATQIDPLISFRWRGCPPETGMSASTFSVQWTGQVEAAYSEPYTFTADVSGGVSVIVNGVTVVSSWTDSGLRIPPSSVVTLTAGVKVPIEVDYFSGGANTSTTELQLIWQSPSQASEFVPREYLFSGAALNPTPTPQTPSGCQFSPTVDGQLNEWAWNQGLPWNTVNKTVWGNAYGATASFKTLWDPNNLYIGVTVTDSQLTPTGASPVWEYSAVEVFIDTTDSKTVTVNNTDFQYIFGWNDTTPSEANGRTAGVSMKTATIPGGYVVEASIPCTTLGLSSLSSGKVLGFDVGVDVNHNLGNCRDGQLMWNGGYDNYSDASRYGDLTLANACPTPVSTPPAPTGQPYVSPNSSTGTSVQFTYEMAQAGTAHIKVWNAWGNLVGSISDVKSSGLQSSQMDVSTFAPGHYFYKVELDYNSGQSDKFNTAVLAIKK